MRQRTSKYVISVSVTLFCSKFSQQTMLQSFLNAIYIVCVGLANFIDGGKTPPTTDTETVSGHESRCRGERSNNLSISIILAPQLLPTTCGTPEYVAPEVWTRESLGTGHAFRGVVFMCPLQVLANKGYCGEKTDVWSCGVIFYVSQPCLLETCTIWKSISSVQSIVPTVLSRRISAI